MISLRTCCVCRNKFPKSELTRIVKTTDGKINIEKFRRIEGRGAYICKCDECRSKLKKLKSLNKAFKCAVSDEIYEELLKTKEI